VIPLRDVIPSRTTPFVTVLILILNAVGFLFELAMSEREFSAFVMRHGLVPAWFEWRSLVTSMFLHANWLHFGTNMLYLWIFGGTVEDRIGHGRFAIFYVLCGTGAAFGQMAANPFSVVPMVGTSGAIAGIMGAYFILFPRSRVLTLVPLLLFIELVEVPAIFFLGVWFLLQFVSGSGAVGGPAAGVAFWAHAAGFAAGASLIFLFRRPERLTVEWTERPAGRVRMAELSRSAQTCGRTNTQNHPAEPERTGRANRENHPEEPPVRT
jgi:membrane associated rhomboid family serine protease